MLYAAIALFSLAAIFGITVLVNWLRNKDAPKAVIFTHGGLAITALILVIVYAVQNPGYVPKVSLVLFPMAAVGGIYMLYRNLAKHKHPIPIAFIHAGLAVSGLIALLVFTF